ncbi:MAG: fumarylacetoacetate hydrolase family protein [Acidimicrobiia bacterium]
MHDGEIAGDRFVILAGDPVVEHVRTGRSRPLADVVMMAPRDDPRFVIVMGGFLAPGTSRPADMKPRWIPKAPNFVSGDGAAVVRPASLTGPLQVEAELAVVIGATVQRAGVDEARAAIFGWTVCNDITAPEFGATGDWSTGKSLDGFASFGPWVRTDLSEERVLDGLAITAVVNGQLRQSGSTANFRFTPSEIISDISHRITLFPGDIVSLGTPPPPADVVVGDDVVLEVEAVGRLRNHVIADG